jgi:hypothetical protein
MDGGPQNLAMLRHMALNAQGGSENVPARKTKKSRMEQQLPRQTPRPFLKCNRPRVPCLNRNQYARDLDGG